MQRRRRAAERRKTMWLSAAQSGCGERLNVTFCQENPLDFDTFILVENPASPVPGIVDSVGEVTVVRLVGDLTWTIGLFDVTGTGQNATSLAVYAGIDHSDTDDVGAPRPLNPALSADQESKDWMWRYSNAGLVITDDTTTAVSAEPSLQSGGVVFHEHLDIRVKRKVKKEEGIYLRTSLAFDRMSGNSITEGLIVGLLFADLRALVMLP